MIVSLVLTLRAERPVVLPAYLGRASHAAFLRLVDQADAALAERLHAPDARRPFTCSPLMGGRRRGRSLEVGPEDALYVRYTGLDGAVSALLARWAEEPPSHLELEGATLVVEGATVDPAAHPWAGCETYEDLAARHLLPSGSPSARLELEFASPTTFRSGGRALPVPLPDRVFGSLVEKWNSFSPVAVSEEVRRFAEECLAISRYRLATRVVPGKGDSVLIGFVGWCRYVALNRDRYWLSLLQLLTDYAFYAGVGYQTTVGMGQVRRRPEAGR
ncbi:MAG TPA: CRISPR system precrRNA processing endoribonuclease RAMP protein Cas6 [Thermoflexia bacterium]|nr:CRISPR system precrRNA processing endoribonuclease RAMP protein Cas6 [Thermoflexia bacterium]